MKLKVRPEDFRVDERIRWDEDPRGAHRVYRITKRQTTTFDAIRRIAGRARVPINQISYAGLKDMQGVTSQHISIPEAELPPGSLHGIEWTRLGRSAKPISSHDLISNDFTIVARELTAEEARTFPEQVTALAAHGVPNYFDDQRFGGLVRGQGLIGRALARGQLEEATVLLLIDGGGHDLKWAAQARELWGRGHELVKFWGHRPGVSMLRHLAKRPGDFSGAWQRLPGQERALHLFAYQSWLWNMVTKALIESVIPTAKRVDLPSVMGPLPCWSYAASETIPELPATVPLLDDVTPIADARLSAIVDELLKAEGFSKRADFRSGVPRTSFKFEERPLTLKANGLMVTKPPDRAGTCTLTFSLPPGAYATLITRRLFANALTLG